MKEICGKVQKVIKNRNNVPNIKAVNKYIIYTTEGYTTAPNESYEVENCQVLGFARGNNPDEAKDNLLKDNSWIAEAVFNRSEFIVEQLLSEEERAAIKDVIDYLWNDEEKHDEESGMLGNHIFPILKFLKEAI